MVKRFCFEHLFLLPVIIGLAYFNCHAQVYVPKYSNEFLSIGVGGRAQAMGNAQVAISNDLTAGYWNPAGLVQIRNKYQFSLMHAEFFAGVVNYDCAAFATPLDSNSTLGINFIRFGVDDIADTRYLIVADAIDYSRIQRFSAADNALLLSYARKNLWLKGLNGGASFKIIYRNAGNFASAWGFGLDAGLQYHSPKGLMLGFMARDATSTFNAWSYNTSELATVFSQTGNKIPESSIEITLPKWILGGGYNFNIKNKFGILATADLATTFDGKRNVPVKLGSVSMDPSIGLEGNYKQLCFIRLGASNFQKIKNFDGSNNLAWQPGFGLGLRLYNILGIDYALTNLGTISESVYSHIFSLRLDLK